MGHVTLRECDSGYPQFVKLVGAQPEGFTWVMDCLPMTGFDAAAIAAGKRWFEVAYHRRAQLVVLSTNPAARMAAATLSFSIGIPTVAVGSLREAIVAGHLDAAQANAIEAGSGARSVSGLR